MSTIDYRTQKYLEIKNYFKYFLFLIILFFLRPLSKMFYSKRNVWLICERGYDAQDNGFIFFQYLTANHKEIDCFYLIKKNSKDYKKVSQKGKTIEFGSLKHFFIVIGCKVKISTQLFGYAPWLVYSTYLRRNKSKDVHVFLQHGITKNFHPGLLYDTCKSLKLFVCGSKPEYDYIFSIFNYKNSIPQYTGFARFDLLHDFKTKNEILIMPTWRTYLTSLSLNDFYKSNFYNQWNSLLKNKIFKNFLEKHFLKVKFFLHPLLQKYSVCFNSDNFIEIVNNSDVQELLKSSILLITDFSSVYFDFAYMDKPVLYYQFDEIDYFKFHYEKGYFDYRKDGFGDVCTNINDLLQSLTMIANNKFSINELYKTRINNFFIYKDRNNSKRIFDAIQKLL